MHFHRFLLNHLTSQFTLVVGGCSREVLMTLLTTENVFLEFSHVLEALEEHLQDVQLPLGSPD